MEDFTLQYADDTKVLLHSRNTQQAWGPHAETCECVRCVAERVRRDELPECFAEGDMKLSVDRTTYGTMDARRVPASTKLVGSYMEEFVIRLT